MLLSRTIRIATLVAAIFCLVNTADAADSRVVLKSAASASGPIVRLGDIAVVESSEIADVELMPSPQAGEAVYLTINEIRSILTSYGVDSIRISGPSRVKVSAGANASPAPRRTFSGTKLIQPVSHSETSASSSPAATIAFHAIRNIRRGELIHRTDLELRAVSLIRTTTDYATDLSQIVGKQAERSISVDRPISLDDVREPIIVRRNDVVTVTAYSGNVMVQRVMLSLTDGGMRQLIEVQPIEPKLHGRARQAERFVAQVVGPGEAIVLTGHVQVHNSQPVVQTQHQENVR